MKKIIFILAAASIALGCSKDDKNDGGGTDNTNAAVLSAPANNTECLTGTTVSATESSITFTWAAADGTEKYFVYVKDLAAQGAFVQYPAGTATSLDITLKKGTPYSWYVSAKKSSGNVNSETWKFYNAGSPVTTHAPFPAEAVSPVMSSTVNGPTITLHWAGSDIDNDIAEYNVYMDGNANPATILNTVTVQQLSAVPVTSGGTYYWKVVTVDTAGNQTASPVYQFKVY
ncbi:hypothetical protein ACLI09_06700 [Flavobacterium sp. RHBU_24]|uniref:hypothetical protein n=1 Tax=Flavobacterium sp. RHBU_24 TaxID=3391185 RepID=UPI00398521D6